MEEAIAFGLNKLDYKTIRENQRTAVMGYLNRQDVLLCSPTGSGKSFVFEIAPLVFSFLHHRESLPYLTSSVIVISPLVSLMRAQVEKLKSLGLRAAYLTDVTVKKDADEITMKDIERGQFEVLLCSPESVLGDHRALVKDLSEKKILRAIFVDEAHCIVKFGKPCPVTRRAAFRPAYGKLGEIRSLAGPDVPVVALTATASFDTIGIIKKDLCFDNCCEIIVSPNKLNIKYDVIDLKSDDVRENFEWLIQLLNKHGVNAPRMIIFFRKVEHMSVTFKHVVNSLGRNAYLDYQEDGKNDDRNRLIDMFHMKTSDVVKSSICKSYEDPAGHIRVVLCSTSFSMGLDVKGVDTVVHYGPANSLEDYIQETGRAGRNPTENSHAILLRYKRSLSSKNISQEMKTYVNSPNCRRFNLLQSFTKDMESISPVLAHMCCDNCTKLCKCLCACDGSCSCDLTCEFKNYTVLQFVVNSVESAFSNSDESSTGFSSDSDFEGFLSKRPTVLQFSDESD